MTSYGFCRKDTHHVITASIHEVILFTLLAVICMENAYTQNINRHYNLHVLLSNDIHKIVIYYGVCTYVVTITVYVNTWTDM